MRKKLVVLSILAAAAVMMVACGRNRDDSAVDSGTSQTETHVTENGRDTMETDPSDDRGVINDAEDLVSDVVDDGQEIVSDVVEGGKDVVSDIADDSSDTSETTHTTTRDGRPR